MHSGGLCIGVHTLNVSNMITVHTVVQLHTVQYPLTVFQILSWHFFPAKCLPETLDSRE